jgi:DNA polymerase-3 subunit gamma/tau
MQKNGVFLDFKIDFMDNYIVSARKYRPSTFAQVVGQESITATLKNAIKTGHLAQAFLFTGPRGVGKTTCARIMAKTINCLNPTADGEPCNECESCRAFNENASFNIHELDAASNNSVDDIRTLVDQVRIPPQAGKYKVYIIDEVHMLSQAAFNAFLKTLEEPPAYAKFILATTEKHKIIPTILSRCQIFDFKRIKVADIASHLAYVAQSEGIEAEEEALHIIAQKVDGALRDALSTFDQIVSYSGKTINYKNVIENLNILDYEYYFKVTDALLHADISSLLLILDEILQNGFDGQDFLGGLNEHFRNLLVVKNEQTSDLLQAGTSLKKRYHTQAEACSTAFLFKALETTNQYDLSYKSSSNKRLHVEIALTQLSTLNLGMPAHNAPNQEPSVTEKPTAYRAIPKPKPDTEKSSPAKKEILKQLADKSQSIKNDAPTPEEQTKTTEETASQKPVNPANPVRRPVASRPLAKSTNGKGRSIRNISIKDSLKALKAEKSAAKNADEPVIDNPFTQDQLDRAWQGFVENYKKQSPSFVLTLAKGHPVLKENFTIEYEVPNLIVKEDKLNVSVLLNFLKNELNNNQIVLQPKVMESGTAREAYTDRERFEKLSEEYPKVKKLKDKLNLELDF